MKKVMFVGIALLMSVGCAQAAGKKWEGGQPSPITDAKSVLSTYKVSNNVTLQCIASTFAYAAYSEHLQGTRVLGAASGDTMMYYQEKNPGSTHAAPASSLSDQFNSGWTSL
ncbi:MAG: hypothetical protein LBD10_09310 [Desulfobulbus sp.]|jgi:hypothetical protein|uniref:hypothetical protein n=1 Tax=Desulfobulbus sp. TaxID=895 RepID=UPI00284A9307|nr:hypothetical protein [Desulfobulbus sp.]MDR2550379.1 hypothetical protein [Desulfobulbus sp.]